MEGASERQPLLNKNIRKRVSKLLPIGTVGRFAALPFQKAAKKLRKDDRDDDEDKYEEIEEHAEEEIFELEANEVGGKAEEATEGEDEVKEEGPVEGDVGGDSFRYASSFSVSRYSGTSDNVFDACAKYPNSPHHTPPHLAPHDDDDGIRRAARVNSLTLPRSLELKGEQAAKQGHPDPLRSNPVGNHPPAFIPFRLPAQ